MEEGNREVLVCECHSLEHQFAIWYDEEFNEITIEPHLILSGTWFSRIGRRIKYLFGHKSRYGAWDEFIIKSDDIPKLREYLDKVEEVEREKTANLGRD